jgi:hypothetical protein
MVSLENGGLPRVNRNVKLAVLVLRDVRHQGEVALLNALNNDGGRVQKCTEGENTRYH